MRSALPVLRLNRLGDLRLLEALRQITSLLGVPVYMTRWFAVTVAHDHKALPAEHPQKKVQCGGGDVILPPQLNGTVHHPLNVNQARHGEAAVVGAEEALCGRRRRDVLKLGRVVELAAAEAHRRASEERSGSATQHDSKRTLQYQGSGKCSWGRGGVR
ncbi:hypothetical protein, conserved [Leishmania tarentolae]|uniref:Uncharacterized protein n=1 Tax=Leishmania tarentolae TaxID=5689 RepID=A0A640KJ03_LEITA|nr:hypothetical protein, conserved [Leishmania tarentolae]